MKSRLPSLPKPELKRISNGEIFTAEQLQLLKKAQRIAMDNSVKASEEYRSGHDEKAIFHS
jgi:hypothetical protein